MRWVYRSLAATSLVLAAIFAVSPHAGRAVMMWWQSHLFDLRVRRCLGPVGGPALAARNYPRSVLLSCLRLREAGRVDAFRGSCLWLAFTLAGGVVHSCYWQYLGRHWFR